MPPVTVVIPTYDRAAELPRAIRSVRTQTYEDFELLVVDDGSTDGTGDVLAGIEDPRLVVETHETNRGADVARNTGIERATGEYVAFLDSDDEWHPEKLERQLDRLRGTDATGVYCDFEYAASGLRGAAVTTIASILSRDDGPREGGVELAGEILADNLHPAAGSTLLVETDVAASIGGFDTALERFQDTDFMLRVVRNGQVVYVDDPLVVRHETGSPAAETVERADEHLLGKHADLVERFERAGYPVHAAHALVLAKEHFRDGNFRRAIDHLARADAPPRHWPGIARAASDGIRRDLAGG